MKKIFVLFFSLVIVAFFSGNAVAQEKAKTEITTVKQKGTTVRVSLASSKPFIFGSNRYILYIGNKSFMLNEQSHKNGKGYMTFLIPADEFKTLGEGANMYLSYGPVNVEEQDMEQLAKGRRCWSIGKFSKSLLK
jgi:hypothetical protein